MDFFSTYGRISATKDAMRSLVHLNIAAVAGCCLVGTTPANCADSTTPSTNYAAQAKLTLEPSAPGIWKSEVGQGFLRSAHQVSVTAGAGWGMQIFGGQQKHDLALGGVSYGHIWGDVKGEGRFYRGNWEWRVELFGGGQFSPSEEYVLGGAAHLRYNFATGSRFVPFFDLGAGLTATDIRAPDLGGPFQFNLQPGAGVNYFLRDDLALSVEYRLLHMSNARLYQPNLGVNTSMVLAGLNWFF
jgi:lipid A 3-O-deacylase